MSFGAVSEIFDQRRAEIAPRPLGRPFRHGMDGEVVVAVHAQRRDAEAEPEGERRDFGNLGRSEIRRQATLAALKPFLARAPA